jgi:hypothetical protein
MDARGSARRQQRRSQSYEERDGHGHAKAGRIEVADMIELRA